MSRWVAERAFAKLGRFYKISSAIVLPSDIFGLSSLILKFIHIYTYVQITLVKILNKTHVIQTITKLWHKSKTFLIFNKDLSNPAEDTAVLAQDV